MNIDNAAQCMQPPVRNCPPMSPKMIENDGVKVLWDFQIQTDKMLMTNQPDMVVVDKQEKKAPVVDLAIPNDSNIRKKEHKKLEK